MRAFITRYRRLLAVILFLGILLVTFELSGIRGHLTLAFLQQQIQGHRISGLLIFVALFALGNLIQIPGWLFLAAAVLTLGGMTGGMVTYLAALVSCSATFIVVRSIGGDALRQLDNKLAVRLLSQLDAHPIRSIFLLRLLFQTMPVINYALAVSGVQFRKYLIGTLLGLPLPILLYCLLFDTFAHLLPMG